jgi:hypothetical protein
VSHFGPSIVLNANYDTVWTVWEQEAEKHKKAGVQAELDRRRDAEAMKAEIKNSLK